MRSRSAFRLTSQSSFVRSREVEDAREERGLDALPKERRPDEMLDDVGDARVGERTISDREFRRQDARPLETVPAETREESSCVVRGSATPCASPRRLSVLSETPSMNSSTQNGG